jgi:hypothetical protein
VKDAHSLQNGKELVFLQLRQPFEIGKEKYLETLLTNFIGRQAHSYTLKLVRSVSRYFSFVDTFHTRFGYKVTPAPVRTTYSV